MDLMLEWVSGSYLDQRKWKTTFSGQVECCRMDSTAAMVPRR